MYHTLRKFKRDRGQSHAYNEKKDFPNICGKMRESLFIVEGVKFFFIAEAIAQTNSASFF